jgi:predicted Zn-dependent protease with MMP-like domain
MDRKRFEELVAEAIDGLPDDFRVRLENIAIVVEDKPSREIQSKFKGRLLLGLYTGVPLSDRSVWSNYPLPDFIAIYQRNIERICRTDREIIDQVRKTVIHEIGHYFGMDEDDLRQSGY